MLDQAAVLQIVVCVVALPPKLELVVAVAGVTSIARIQNGVDGVVVIHLSLAVCVDEVILIVCGLILPRIHKVLLLLLSLPGLATLVHLKPSIVFLDDLAGIFDDVFVELDRSQVGFDEVGQIIDKNGHILLTQFALDEKIL